METLLSGRAATELTWSYPRSRICLLLSTFDSLGHSLILVWTRGHWFCHLNYSLMLFLLVSLFCQPWRFRSLLIGSCALWHTPICGVLFSAVSCLVGSLFVRWLLNTMSCSRSRSPCVFSAPSLHNLSAKLCFLLLDSDIRNQDLGTRCLEWILYLLVSPPALIPMRHGHQTSLP